VYAALPDGVYEFDNKHHVLNKVINQDIRKEVPIQPEFRSAGMIVLYVANKSRFRKGENPWADLEIGCMVQDTYLEAASLGLSACVFALVRYDNVSKLMGLKSNQSLRIAQAVGHPK
jgi:nitroreductase